MSINFNSSVDTDLIQKEYSHDKRVRISDVLNMDTAGQLAMRVHSDLKFSNAYFENGESKSAAPEELLALSQAQKETFQKNLYANARQGIGFFYERHALSLNTWDLTIIQQCMQWLNSPETIETIRKISGFEDIISASAQATRFYPGHFLTRHNDVHPSEQRRVAYVLNLTPDWHPDWGGLLQFYQNDGTPRDAWTPLFNSMALFDVNHVHAVTYIAPYANKPRLSISGWFNATPLPGA
jgi:SM-20-related protein